MISKWVVLIIRLTIAVVTFLVLGAILNRYTIIQNWVVGIILLIFGLALYLTSVMLVYKYARERAPFIDRSNIELTAGQVFYRNGFQ